MAEEIKTNSYFLDVYVKMIVAPLSLVVKNDNQSVSSDFEKYLLIGHFNFNKSNTGYVRKIYSDIGEETISFNFSFNEIEIQELGTRVMIAEYQLEGHEDDAWAKLYVRKVSEENFVCDLETSSPEGDKSWSINQNTFYNIALVGHTFFGYVKWSIMGLSLIDVPIEYTSNVTLDLKCWFDEDISSDDYLYNAYILFKDITGLGNDALQYTRRYSTFVSQISDLLLIPTAWGIFETIKTNSETALIDYYTQTSDDGITFDDWELVNSATYEIGSELKRYIRWKAVLKSTNRLSILQLIL